MKYGLSKADIQTIVEILRRFPEIQQAILFGSRATGTHKPGSDIDLALRGALCPSTIIQVKQALEDTNLPWFFDVVDEPSLSNEALRAHIDSLGKLLYCNPRKVETTRD
jgi:predicted nucleotidyltransferase